MRAAGPKILAGSGLWRYAPVLPIADPAHRENLRAYRRDYQRQKNYKTIYGITVADYDAMFARQGGACAVCKRTDRKPVVDHCH